MAQFTIQISHEAVLAAALASPALATLPSIRPGNSGARATAVCTFASVDIAANFARRWAATAGRSIAVRQVQVAGLAGTGFAVSVPVAPPPSWARWEHRGHGQWVRAPRS